MSVEYEYCLWGTDGFLEFKKLRGKDGTNQRPV